MKTVERLRELKLVNSYELCARGGGKVWIAYRSRDLRSCIPSAWRVIGLDFDTDPKAHWADYRCKSFMPFHKTRAEALAEAQKWAGERYGIAEWARDPYGAYQDARVIAWMKRLLRDAEKKL